MTLCSLLSLFDDLDYYKNFARVIIICLYTYKIFRLIHTWISYVPFLPLKLICWPLRWPLLTLLSGYNSMQLCFICSYDGASFRMTYVKCLLSDLQNWNIHCYFPSWESSRVMHYLLIRWGELLSKLNRNVSFQFFMFLTSKSSILNKPKNLTSKLSFGNNY